MSFLALIHCALLRSGVVRGHKMEGHELFYSVEKDGQRQWHSRTAVILSLEQGNKLREQHSLGPYEPSTPLAKASDISLGEARETPFPFSQGFLIIFSRQKLKIMSCLEFTFSSQQPNSNIYFISFYLFLAPLSPVFVRGKGFVYE